MKLYSMSSILRYLITVKSSSLSIVLPGHFMDNSYDVFLEIQCLLEGEFV